MFSRRTGAVDVTVTGLRLKVFQLTHGRQRMTQGAFQHGCGHGGPRIKVGQEGRGRGHYAYITRLINGSTARAGDVCRSSSSGGYDSVAAATAAAVVSAAAAGLAGRGTGVVSWQAEGWTGAASTRMVTPAPRSLCQARHNTTFSSTLSSN